MVSIRYATTDDAELIADMSREAFLSAFGPQNTASDIDKFMKEQFSREALVAEVGSSGNFFLLAEIENQPVGYVRLKEDSFENGLEAKKPLEIARFYAIPQMIGKGIGKAMMSFCLQFARDLQKDVIWLGVWENNARTIAFYSSFGFIKFAEHGFLVGDDLQNDHLMRYRIEK